VGGADIFCDEASQLRVAATASFRQSEDEVRDAPAALAKFRACAERSCDAPVAEGGRRRLVASSAVFIQRLDRG